MRSACLTLVNRPGSTLPDVLELLTDAAFRRHVLERHVPHPMLARVWADYDQLTPGAQAQLNAPLVSRLRGVLSRQLARDLLGSPASTIELSEVLDGGILIARLPKGELGEDTARLLGSLVLAGVWAHTTRRSRIPQEARPDATVIVDEAHNFLHLPLGMDDTLAESRGYRVSWVIAHQHLGQLPVDVRDAVDANGRNKLIFTVSPSDAQRLARHVGPHFDEYDLARRPAFSMTARILHNGNNQPAFTLDTLPLPPPIPGRAHTLQAAARARSGMLVALRQALAARMAVTGSSRLFTQPDRPTPALPAADTDGRDRPVHYAAGPHHET
ncbi:MAG: helicase HerA domain-containing protein, partial [Actinomycetes bacterium]